MRTLQEIQNKLADLVQRKTGVRPQPTDSLAELQIDSLAMAELTVEIEQAFGIRIGDDVTDVTDMAGLAEYVAERQACDLTH